jgi:hypothetical protein
LRWGLLAHLDRDVNAARLGQRLQSRGDIDAVAVEIVTVDHDVAEVDADAEHDSAVFRQVGVRGFHAVLEVERAVHGVDSAAERDQHAVAGHLEDAAVMLGHQRLQHLLAPLLQRRQRAGLVLLHEAAVADHVGGENGGKTAFHRGAVSVEMPALDQC